MPASRRGNGSYYLDFSGHVAEQLRMLQRRAERRGQGTAFALASRRIIKALRRDPLSVGEPLYLLPALALQVRIVAVSPLVIDYAVDARRAIVYLRVCKLLSPLESKCFVTAKMSGGRGSRRAVNPIECSRPRLGRSLALPASPNN